MPPVRTCSSTGMPRPVINLTLSRGRLVDNETDGSDLGEMRRRLAEDAGQIRSAAVHPDGLSVLAAVVITEEGYRRFAFMDNVKPVKLKRPVEEAEHLGYHVIEADSSHAEMKLLQWVLIGEDSDGILPVEERSDAVAVGFGGPGGTCLQCRRVLEAMYGGAAACRSLGFVGGDAGAAADWRHEGGLDTVLQHLGLDAMELSASAKPPWGLNLSEGIVDNEVPIEDLQEVKNNLPEDARGIWEAYGEDKFKVTFMAAIVLQNWKYKKYLFKSSDYHCWAKGSGIKNIGRNHFMVKKEAERRGFHVIEAESKDDWSHADVKILPFTRMSGEGEMLAEEEIPTIVKVAVHGPHVKECCEDCQRCLIKAFGSVDVCEKLGYRFPEEGIPSTVHRGDALRAVLEHIEKARRPRA